MSLIRNASPAFFALLTIGLAPFVMLGCAGHPAVVAAPASTGANVEEVQFLADLKNLPTDQRATYVQSHKDMATQIMNGNDTNMQMQLRQSLMK